MSPEQHALLEARHAANVANAALQIMRAQDFDRVRCACGLAVMSTAIAGDDLIARAMLAKTMIDLAFELDADVFGAMHLQ
jgi:hypothetical protein